MRTRSSTKAKRRVGRVATKMPKIEFNKKGIEAIKRRKKGVYKRWLKQSQKKEVG